ncbi:hypothetical protein H257_10478 [Aphanomyces astaci]|uniref:DDE Tnp4 domain-containing protein n=1 Tax=Aphanomyces astaci TaxID=112090 RepID=W4G6J2_APHAT|nr:hypothetical protein H257_10478 [Aphanomyces astaci]ETV75295.1 hypothetical protein H257_10478 [Aphanomyces astaci]|eukprot:XP_009835343.1 hypothetical protein H257_10478 [Aphanomyces astaci]
MVGHPQYEKWFKANLRCSQATFGRLVEWLRHELPERYRRLSYHSFKKKVAVVLYFLGSDGGYRETAAAFGMSKSWCINVVSVLVGVLSSSAENVDQSTKKLRGTVMNEKSLNQTTTVVTACFVLHNMFLYFNDGLFAIPNRRRDGNDQVQPLDQSESETNPFLRKTALTKRTAIARILY